MPAPASARSNPQEMPSARSTLPAWRRLVSHRRAAAGLKLRELFARDPARFRRFSAAAEGILLDYSKQLVTRDTMRQAGLIAGEDIAPISDVRGSADYRRQLARNVFLRFYHDHAARTAAGTAA